ncbi:hypothetical protein [Streptomyces rishiriensis]|uniref:Uncharacterized protein n=1 Tax=Streptomyces rishiriensis TaxID=68264 RepID=A0ABU0NQB5_STRRH|nr:hypothetical protein [Streptomyces rishiriensis]MDQ0580705.1 hypothetical protein [Streptomyces rishiriensis]
MRRWEKALLAVDRVLGTGEPPSRLELAAARHPVRVGVTSGTVMAVLIAAALSGFDDLVILFQATLTGAGLGLLLWAGCRNARWLHAYYARAGRYEEVRHKALRAEPPSRRAMILRVLGVWVIASGAIWVMGPFVDIPRSLAWAVSFGALVATVGATGTWLQRRRLHGFEVSDRSVANRDLTFRYERAFQLWSYGASHRQLVLRSGPGGGLEDAVEIEFLDVLGMKVKSRYRELLILPAPDAVQLDEFVDVPERRRADYVKLLVTDGSGDGFVICRALRVHEK